MKWLKIILAAVFISAVIAASALAVDTDLDGLDDSVETNTGVYIGPLDTGTDPLNPDTDADGVMDGQEVNSGSHPLDPAITPSSWQVGSDTRITSDIASSGTPSIVWNGTEYGVTWNDWRDGNWEIYFCRIDTSGTKIGSDVRISNEPSVSVSSSLVWTGTEYGVSWRDDRDVNNEIYFARIDSAGNKIEADVRITNDPGVSERPSLVWTGTEYGVSWYDDRDGNWEIYFARIDSVGNKIGSDLRITNAPGDSDFPDMVWTGTEYGVSWQDGRGGVGDEIYFARISSLGSKIGSDMRITNNPSQSSGVSLVWAGTEYGVSWYDNRDGNREIYFAHIDASGNKIGSEVRITNNINISWWPSLTWTGTEYGVSWRDYRDGNSEIFFARIDASGNKIGADSRITNDAASSSSPSLVWTGIEYGVSWRDTRDGNSEIYFARIAVDDDGDGLDPTQESSIGTNPNDWDTDNDGMPDGWEYNNGLNPLVNDAGADPDTDGLTNLQEYTLGGGTDPYNWDTDGDTSSDGDEVSNGTDPTNSDTDGDGLSDGVETNTGVYNGPLDTGTDPLDPDTDFDGVMDGPEVNSGSHPLYPTITPSSWQIGADSRVTNTVGWSQDPSLVWTGTEYGVSWEDYRDGGGSEIYFARIDGLGNKIGTDVRITNAANWSSNPSLVWTGTEYGVSWHDYRDGNSEIYFARMDTSGNKIGPDVRITNDAAGSVYPSLVWTGTEYGVSWGDYRNSNLEIYFVRIDASGNKIGADSRITNAAADSRNPSLVWTGTEYGVSWEDTRDLGGNGEIYFARIDASGNKIGADMRITNAASFSWYPSIAWTGTEYGVSWQDRRDGNWEIYFARIDASGNKIGADVRITTDLASSTKPSLVWTDTEYGVSWYDDRDGNYEIYFARIDSAGTKIGADSRITNDALTSWEPSLVWTGTEYGVSWQDNRDGIGEVYFALIGVDEDGDGLDPTQESSILTNPSDWDTDDDTISDGDEYWNPTLDPLTSDVICSTPGINFGLHCWADANGDGLVSGLDVIILNNYVLSKPADFNAVYPSNANTGDVNGDGTTSGLDIIIFNNWILSKPALPEPPSSVNVVIPIGNPIIPIGGTQTITVEVLSGIGTPLAGVGVVFEITGPGTLLGGRGNAAGLADPDGGNFPANSRWDITGPTAGGGMASITVRVDGTGPITVNARIPKRLAKGLLSGIQIPAPVTINP